MEIAVIGGGAAGFFAAINCAEEFPDCRVFIYEKSGKLLSKVRVSGGGRCNVTHACFDNVALIEYYPRGKRELRNAFSRFSTSDTVKWFESRGVKLKTEADGRMFPITDNSATIVNCLMEEADKRRVKIILNNALVKIIPLDDHRYELHFQSGVIKVVDKVIITTGGHAGKSGYDWLASLGHTIVAPVPSLFTFNIPDSPLKGLEGISSIATVSLEGFKMVTTGPLLITHWGISGPAVLKLSAFAARWLNEKSYTCNCFINWFPEMNEEEIRELLVQTVKGNPARKISTISFEEIPIRLWKRICQLAGCEEMNGADINKEKINRLVQLCGRMPLRLKGKTTFKEEFVTCGGVKLSEVNMQTMESRIRKGIYFAGEVLDIDGVTGGFNFQAAWTTGYLAGANAGA